MNKTVFLRLSLAKKVNPLRQERWSIKIRQDAWSEEDDLLLAEVALQHVRDGSTQLKAFKEVGSKLNRTAAACGFRWNSVVRKQYEKAFALAKQQRKQLQHFLQEEEEAQGQELRVMMADTGIRQNARASFNTHALTMNQVIDFLHRFEAASLESENLREKLETVMREKADLETKYNMLEKRAAAIQEDHEAMIQIFERARQMVFLNETSNVTIHIDEHEKVEKMAK